MLVTTCMLIKGVARGSNQLLGSGPPVQKVAHPCTRLKEAPSSFRATRDAMLSASHVATTALPQICVDWIFVVSVLHFLCCS